MGENRKTHLIQEKGPYVQIRYVLISAEGEYVKGDPREGLAILESIPAVDRPAFIQAFTGRVLPPEVPLAA